MQGPLLLSLALLLAWPAAAQLEASQPDVACTTSDSLRCRIERLEGSQRIWVKLRREISIEELATQLAQDETVLARLNDVNEDHQFSSGDWLVLPSQSIRKVKQLAAIDTSELRAAPPPPRLPQPDNAMPRLRGASPAPKKRWDQSLDELVRNGAVTPNERNLVRSGGGALAPLDVGAFQQACRGGSLSPGECRGGLPLLWGRRSPSSQAARPVWPALPATTTTKPLSPREQALLQRIRNGGTGPQWRTYGQCRYDWSGWRLHANGTRTTAADCGGTAMRWTVGVSCKRLLVATYTTASGWSGWERPSGPDNKSRQGEDEMVAALCANATR